MYRYIKSAYDPDVDLDDMAVAQIKTLQSYTGKLRGLTGTLTKAYDENRGYDDVMTDLIHIAGALCNSLQASIDSINDPNSDIHKLIIDINKKH